MATTTNPNTFDADGFKSAMRSQWDQAATGWNAHTAQIRAWLGPATEAMLEMSGVRRGARVLDVAAGAGDQTLDIARRVGPKGYVLATDLSPAILALAQANARRAGFDQMQTRVADGEHLPVESASFDAAVCRLGLMFFPDPLQGLRQMRRALKPGAGICTMVFSRPERNPCITTLMSTALKHAGLPPRDPFAPGGLLSPGQARPDSRTVWRRGLLRSRHDHDRRSLQDGLGARLPRLHPCIGEPYPADPGSIGRCCRGGRLGRNGARARGICHGKRLGRAE